jgi:hypothetical protein
LRELLLTEAAERIKQKISQILAAKTKGREIFSEEEDEDDEDAEIESTPTVDKAEELDGDEED